MYLLADTCFANIINSGNIIPITGIVFGCTVGMVAIVAQAIRSAVVGRAREQTKRELAAYVAEGSIDADKAVELVNAGKGHSDV
jgi:hypothetical protein